jgi:hypothetical protein
MIKNRPAPNGLFGTHIHPLIVATLNTTGSIIEFGTGDWSTPILHEICKYQERHLISYDSSKEWYTNFTDMESAKHSFVLVDDWKDIMVHTCGVVLIDHAPAERRAIDIIRFKEHAQIIVVHDTDKMYYYNYLEVFKQFTYVYTYERYKKSTTLLSNFIDVSKLF